MLRIICIGTGEMVQQSKALAALPEDPGLTPSTHMVAHNTVTVQGMQHPLLAPIMPVMHRQIPIGIK